MINKIFTNWIHEFLFLFVSLSFWIGLTFSSFLTTRRLKNVGLLLCVNDFFGLLVRCLHVRIVHLNIGSHMQGILVRASIQMGHSLITNQICRRGKRYFLLGTCLTQIIIRTMIMSDGIHGEDLWREALLINRGYGLREIMKSILLLKL